MTAEKILTELYKQLCDQRGLELVEIKITHTEEKKDDRE